MNGIDAVALATGNDWRAIEAGAHAWCARDGQYRPMTRWEVDADGTLHGTLELPLQFATVGGPIAVHPTVAANHALLGARGAEQVARRGAPDQRVRVILNSTRRFWARPSSVSLGAIGLLSP